MEDKTFVVIDEQGKEIECEVLFTFDSDETGKSYVLYFEKGQNEDEQVEIFASVYDPEKEDGGELTPVETDEEWEMIEEVLNTFSEEEE